MEPFHLIISAIFSPVCVLLFPAKLNKFGALFNLLIGFCCDSGYVWRTVIEWLVWFGRKNPNSPVSTGDVTASTPGAKATECIAEACHNSAHTHHSSAAWPGELFSFLLTALSRIPRDHVFWIETVRISMIQLGLNLSLRISVPPVMKITGRQVFKFFEMKQQDLEANLNIHLSVHVLLWSFEDFPQLLLRPYRNSENKTSANTDGILFSLRGGDPASRFQVAVLDLLHRTTFGQLYKAYICF